MANTEYISYILQALEPPLWGRWELKERIRSSAEGDIYRLESRRMNRTESALMKVVPLIADKSYFSEEQKLGQIERAKELAEQESELLFRLEGCPNIVTYQDEEMHEIQVDGQFEGYAYLIRTEALEPLSDCIRSHRFYASEENVMQLAKEIALALYSAHQQGILHRGIHPDQIYLTASGCAKLGGFRPPKRAGLMNAYSDSDGYIAPEIASAKRLTDFTPQADIYAFGITLYQLMNRMALPFETECGPDAAWEKRMQGEPFPKPLQASDVFAKIILKACAYQPEDRYASAEELLAALLFPEKLTETAEAAAPQPEADEPQQTRAIVPEETVQRPAAEISAEEKQTAEALPVPEIPQDDPSLITETDAANYYIRNGILVRYTGSAQAVQIPPFVSAIGKGAFENCTTIRRVIIPEGVMQIEELAFAGCSELEYVQFPNSLRTVHNKAFLKCISLKSAAFRGVLSQIGMSAFEGCSQLASAVFDCPIEKIGFDAFSGCDSLQRIDVSEYSYAYQSVDGVLFDFERKHLVRYPAGRSTPDYIVPDSVFTIEDGAFFGCAGLERIRLAKNVKKIGASAFRDCVRLHDVIFSENLETIKSAAFQGCISLQRLNLPVWTTYIGTYAFSHCENLEAVSLPAKMTELCMGVFEYCKKLTLIRLPESIVKIGEKAFMASGLTEVFVPYSTTKIEKQSFANCEKLQNVFLSNRINQIAPDAFDGNPKSMVVYGLPNSVAADFAKSRRFSFEQIFTLTSGAGAYELRDYKGVFAFVSIPPDVNIIGDNAFKDCTTIREVTLPANIGVIGKGAFENCDRLESVTMTNLIQRVGERAFENCHLLKQFRIMDMSQGFQPKVQRKIHRNFHRVLLSVHPESAEAYARQYNVTAKSNFLDMPFPWQIKKESQEFILRLAERYNDSPFTKALLESVRYEMNRSERRLSRIELFADCMVVTGVRAGLVAKHKTVYNDLGLGVRMLPDINHMLACATVIVQGLGDDFCLADVQNKDSAVIQPSIS